MIPDQIWGVLPQHPGPHRVLLLLWQFSGWRKPPDGRRSDDADPPFAWPSEETIATRLGIQPRAVRAALERLAEFGWLRPSVQCRVARGEREERSGWRLFEDPADALEFDRAQAEAAQLDLFAGCPQPVDNCAGAHENQRTCAGDSTHLRTELDAGAHENRRTCAEPSLLGSGVDLNSDLVVKGAESGPDHDDDVPLRLWRLYEAERVRELGDLPGQPPDRGGRAPHALVMLFAALGGTPEAERQLERYVVGSIALVVDAARVGRTAQAASLAALRCDGGEWSRRRFDAVIARLDASSVLERLATRPAAPSSAPAPSRPPLPDPVVDGERVSRFERDIFEQGGPDAVRAHRRDVASAPSTGVAYISDWLREGRLPPEPTPTPKASP